LKRYGAIKSIPASISRNNYIGLEEAMRNFSKKVKIPMEELDLLFWSAQTGFVFK
jgi:thermostable 8-oxoguanine DNA glycosylase